MNDWKEKLKNPPKKYRPLPFWSWNEQLRVEETARQIGCMDEAGMGGYFMHARGGLQTEYLGGEWMDNVRCGIEEGVRRGMEAWGYDENGWPSGFGGGIVNGLGEEYQQKYLRFEETEEPCRTEHTITNVPFDGKNLHFYYEVNPFYVDLLDRKITAAFLENVHEHYVQALGEKTFGGFAGFFTDEPQVSRNGIPWSLVMEEAYEKRYDEKLAPLLAGLFFETPDCERVRFRFWQLVRDLFCDGYMHQLYDWCEEHNTCLTGHMVLEDSLIDQLTPNGACMPNYEFLHMPGVDWLGRRIGSSVTAAQVASVAAQTGKKQVLTETFAMCGWDVSFEELKWIAEWQMVRGVNRICQHLEGYSLRGLRKRDYPATLYFQQPWWPEYRKLNDFFSRMGMLLSEGEPVADTLVLHPMSSAWLNFNNRDYSRLQELDESFAQLLKTLDEAQIPYHLGDERLMAERGAVEGSLLRVGECRYRAVVVPDCSNLASETLHLLEIYRKNGGLLLFSREKPTRVGGQRDARADALCETCPGYATAGELVSALPETVHPFEFFGDGRGVATAVRRFPDCQMLYMVNTDDEKRRFSLKMVGGSVAQLDYMTGELCAVPYEAEGDTVSLGWELPAMGSVALFVFADNRFSSAAVPTPLRPLNDRLGTVWELGECDENALTLDYCDYYFDGQLQGTNQPVLNVQEKACQLERPVEVELLFRFQVEKVPEKPAFLVLETPEKFTVSLNGHSVDTTPAGFYWDTSFQKLPLPAKALAAGENELRLTVHFTQSEEVYRNLRNALEFETEKNKLAYDTELEAVYLVGDFGVKAADAPEQLERRGVRYAGPFTVMEKPERLSLGDITEQGFPFFAGRMTLCQRVRLTADECAGRSLRFACRCDTVTRVRVNGREAGTVFWQPYEVSLDGLLQEGENVIEIEIVGNLRNLLGPHHLKCGEDYGVCPSSFYADSPVWCGGKNSQWDDRYCFVRHGVYLDA